MLSSSVCSALKQQQQPFARKIAPQGNALILPFFPRFQQRRGTPMGAKFVFQATETRAALLFPAASSHRPLLAAVRVGRPATLASAARCLPRLRRRRIHCRERDSPTRPNEWIRFLCWARLVYAHAAHRITENQLMLAFDKLRILLPRLFKENFIPVSELCALDSTSPCTPPIIYSRLSVSDRRQG